VIGGGSFVNRSIPPYRVAAGVPCRVIGKVGIDRDGTVRLEYDGARRPVEPT
jgi:acetyltransferase-like isoleucine patch superfamily enzyme